VEELGERLTRLIASPEKRKAMGQAGRKRFESEFMFEGMYKKTTEIYQEVIRNLS
jgi:glycosyltransferase involved in cell wall biosynthesis